MVFYRRNKIYRSFIAAIAGLILAASQQPAKQSETAKGNAKTASVPEQPATPANATQSPYRAYPDKNADACYNAKDHDSADLCAQWRAAIAAEKAAKEAARATNWAIIATMLSFLGVGGLIYTIWQTHGALKAARDGNRIAMKANARSTRQAVTASAETAKALTIAERNAAAAEAQITITEKSSELQLRAYLAVVDVKVENYRVGERPIFSFNLVNYGKTPARKVKGLAALFFESEMADRRGSAGKPLLSFTKDHWRAYKNNRGFVLGPGEKRPFLVVSAHAVIAKQGTPDIPNVSSSLEGVEYAGYFSYLEQGGGRRRLIFRYTSPAHYRSDGSGNLVSQIFGNHAT